MKIKPIEELEALNLILSCTNCFINFKLQMEVDFFLSLSMFKIGLVLLAKSLI